MKERVLSMRAMRALVVTCAVLAALPSVAQADLELIGPTPADSFVDLGAQGFGNAPRMLTLQTTGTETGSVTPIDVVHDNAVAGSNKSTTPTLGTLGWATGADVGIGFNSDQTGGNGITLQSLVLTIYDGTTAVGSFSLAAPVVFTAADLALQQGNGQAVFNFHLTLAQQAQFDALGVSSGFFAGLASTLSGADDGPDTFVGFAQEGQTVVPEPSALLLAGTALLGVGYSLRHRISRRTRGQLASS